MLLHAFFPFTMWLDLGSYQGFWYFRGRKITENHGNRPTLKITEITENHGKSRKRKLKFLLFAIVVPGRHGKSRKITETEMKVSVVCYCCSWLLSVRVRSFSLAGLVDVKNRQRMGKDLREACVTMFCNGDVQEQFAKWQ